MKIIDPQGFTFIPGMLPHSSLLVVDQKIGNDILAAQWKMNVPFKTLTAAKNAATAGDTIVVMPGTYENECNLLKTLVNWHFMIGAKVVYQDNAPSAGAIFEDHENIYCAVTGHGEFINNHQGVGSLVCNLSDAGGNVYIEARKMVSYGDCINVSAAASLRIRVIDLIFSSTGNALIINHSGCHVNIETDTVEAGANCLNLCNGMLNIKASVLLSSASPAINASGYSDATVIAGHIESTYASQTINYGYGGSAPALKIVGARIINNVVPGGIVIALQADPNGNLVLINCIIISITSGGISISGISSGSMEVQVPGSMVNADTYPTRADTRWIWIGALDPNNDIPLDSGLR